MPLDTAIVDSIALGIGISVALSRLGIGSRILEREPIASSTIDCREPIDCNW